MLIFDHLLETENSLQFVENLIRQLGHKFVRLARFEINHFKPSDCVLFSESPTIISSLPVLATQPLSESYKILWIRYYNIIFETIQRF